MRAMTIAIIASLTIASAVPAVAQEVEPLTIIGQRGDQSFSAIVSFRDLDLTLANGRDELDRRISLAANEVCDRFKVNPSQDKLFMPACTAEAVRRAAPQVGTAVAMARNAAGMGSNASTAEPPR